MRSGASRLLPESARAGPPSEPGLVKHVTLRVQPHSPTRSPSQQWMLIGCRFGPPPPCSGDRNPIHKKRKRGQPALSGEPLMDASVVQAIDAEGAFGPVWTRLDLCGPVRTRAETDGVRRPRADEPLLGGGHKRQPACTGACAVRVSFPPDEPPRGNGVEPWL